MLHIRSCTVTIILALFAVSCGGHSKDSSKESRTSPPNIDPSKSSESVRPVLADQEYTAEDAACFGLGVVSTCTPEQRQRLSEPESITIEKILKPSFVHQPWAGERLKQVFSLWPKSLLPLASCASGIIVGNSIDFSTGGRILYIQPELLAVTAEEIASLDGGADPRTSSLVKAPLVEHIRFVKSDRYFLKDSGLSDEEQAMLLVASFVMIHELSHSCDSNRDKEPLQNKVPPLSANIISKYADVFYSQMDAFKAEVQATPFETYERILANDESLMTYDYARHSEHFADLAHAILLKVFLGIDVRAVLTGPISEGGDAAQLQIKSIFENKVCAPQVWKKSRMIAELMDVVPLELIEEDPSCAFQSISGSLSLGDFDQLNKAAQIPYKIRAKK